MRVIRASPSYHAVARVAHSNSRKQQKQATRPARLEPTHQEPPNPPQWSVLGSSWPFGVVVDGTELKGRRKKVRPFATLRSVERTAVVWAPATEKHHTPNPTDNTNTPNTPLRDPSLRKESNTLHDDRHLDAASAASRPPAHPTPPRALKPLLPLWSPAVPHFTAGMPSNGPPGTRTTSQLSGQVPTQCLDKQSNHICPVSCRLISARTRPCCSRCDPTFNSSVSEFKERALHRDAPASPPAFL